MLPCLSQGPHGAQPRGLCPCPVVSTPERPRGAYPRSWDKPRALEASCPRHCSRGGNPLLFRLTAAASPHAFPGLPISLAPASESPARPSQAHTSRGGSKVGCWGTQARQRRFRMFMAVGRRWASGKVATWLLLPRETLKATASGGQGWKRLPGEGHSGYRQPRHGTQAYRLCPSLQPWPSASPPSLLSLLARARQAQPAVRREVSQYCQFPIPARGCGAEMLFAAGYPPSPTSSLGAARLPLWQGSGMWQMRQKEAPGSPLLLGEADGRHRGRGRQDPGLSRLMPGHPCLQRGQGDSQGTGSVEPAEPGSCTNTRGTITATSEVLAGCLPAGHPSMQSQPSLPGWCTHLAWPRFPPQELPTCRHPAPPRFPLFCRSTAQPNWPSLSLAR